ncbi:MAG: 5-formyltetrahydrofolate cyclo-ligase [Peptococcaceae bacterium]|nr:5-formyltetrahydrofolate cyclo-ligase [Peptococcaceae bacterium]MDH7526102.1 5-formyltetrahydrofolate cyclo-ligase [Peptococcaceae bacterium]
MITYRAVNERKKPMSSAEKKSLRQKMQEMRQSLTALEIETKSRQAASLLLQLSEYRLARTLLAYLPIRGEVDTIPLIITAWQQQKRVVVPTCLPGRRLALSELRSLDELAAGTFGIPEPKAEFLRKVPPGQVDLALLPGVAFDLSGGRLGYGGGYYDRFLGSLRPGCPKIGLAYEFQLVSVLPAEEHDLPVDMVVTDRQVYRCRRR